MVRTCRVERNSNPQSHFSTVNNSAPYARTTRSGRSLSSDQSEGKNGKAGQNTNGNNLNSNNVPVPAARSLVIEESKASEDKPPSLKPPPRDKRDNRGRLKIYGTADGSSGDDDESYVSAEFSDDWERHFDISYLRGWPYDWERFVPEGSLSRRDPGDRLKWTFVCADYCSKEDAITDEEGRQRCLFLKINVTRENVDEKKKEIDIHRIRFKRIVKGFIERFLIDVATWMDMKYDDGANPIRSWEDIQIAFKQVKSKKECIEFVKLVYNSWEFVKGYRTKITQAALRQMGLMVIYPGFNGWTTERINKRVHKRCCFEKLTSLCIQSYRDSLNNLGRATHGLTMCVVRPAEVVEGHLRLGINNFKREYDMVYGWQIRGELVSIRKLQTIM